jgi:hypothetical protein
MIVLTTRQSANLWQPTGRPSLLIISQSANLWQPTGRPSLLIISQPANLWLSPGRPDLFIISELAYGLVIPQVGQPSSISQSLSKSAKKEIQFFSNISLSNFCKYYFFPTLLVTTLPFTSQFFSIVILWYCVLRNFSRFVNNVEKPNKFSLHNRSTE